MNNQIKKELRCVILGGGGHARVLIDSLRENHSVMLHCILDADSLRWKERMFDVPILGDDSMLLELKKQGVNCFVVGVGSTGDSGARKRLYEFGVKCGLEPVIVKDPTSICSKWAEIGKGTQMLPGCIINAGVKLGENVIINSAAVVEHDCRIGDHVHVATGARLASTVEVGSEAHIGAGCVIRECLKIGRGSVVGAGAVVVKDVPSNVVVVGSPARQLRKTVEK